jgi:cation/acetate symporter
MAAQGMMLIYLAIVVIYVRRMRRIEQLVRREQGEHWHGSSKDFFQRLCRYYGFYTPASSSSCACWPPGTRRHAALVDRLPVPVRHHRLYAGIGVISRTSDVPEYYVAGRRVPAIFNGMATAADWISAATFISLAGGLYLHGFDGLAYIMGWTGGYCLVALLIAPYLRKFGQYTIPDFLAARYPGKPGSHGATWSASWPWRPPSCSFTYVVAQIYGVGLITSRFTGIDFSIGIFLGLASILVCSFLGGMRAITWTQVAQYIIILVAYLIPVIWLSAKHADLPVPQVAYGKVLPKLSARSTCWKTIPRKEVRQIFQARADDYDRRLKACRNPGSMAVSRRRTRPTRSGVMRAPRWPTSRPPAARCRPIPNPPTRPNANGPKHARPTSRAQPPVSQPSPSRARPAKLGHQAQQLPGAGVLPDAGHGRLPHILMRYYTTPTVAGARSSVFWTLFFIMLIYLTVPALAVLVKYDIYTSLVGSSYSHLPDWVYYWANMDKLNPLVSINDSTAMAWCSWARFPWTATSSCWPCRRSPACPISSPDWWPQADWRRRCPRRTACC